MTDDLIGKQIGGYEILEQIGQGGMATVYRAHQISMNRVVALKVLPLQFLNDDTYLQRFEREVKIVAQLEHRNIVPVHDYGQHNGQPYIAMRYMPAGSVDDMLQYGPLDIRTILKIVEQIAPALDYAHGKNVLHRDLKPSNVLMDDDGGAYLTDFGIARILGEQGPGITTQGVVGTPSYMSPEQAQAHPLDGRSDVYSLGVMLFEMATGRRPFEADTPYSIAVMQVTTPPPSPRAFNPTLSTAVELVILKTLRKNRDERYPTATALAEALHEAVESPEKKHDTQPRPLALPQDVRANLPPQPAPSSPPPQVVVQPQPVYSPPAYTPQSSRPFRPLELASNHGRGRKRRPGSIWFNVAIGGMIGCGLLAVLVVVAALIISNFTRSAPLETPTPLPGSSPNSDLFSNFNLLPNLDPTSQSARRTLLPDDVSTPPPGSPTPVAAVPSPTRLFPTATEDPAPVGMRPTPTLHPVLAEASGKLVYFALIDGNYEIFTLDLSTRIETQITDGGGTNSYPIASPDGRRIAFQSNRDGDFEIYVMNTSGGDLVKLTDNAVLDRIPAWSPDGEWVIFSSDTRGDGSYDLYRVRPNGSDLELVFSNSLRNSHARWHPNGRLVIFTTGLENDAATWEIGQIDLETGEFTNLTQNQTKDWSPTYSADGNTILYLVSGAGESAIARMDKEGGNNKVIYDGPGYEWGANFSPDGRFIVFNSDATGREELYLMTADGSTVQQLTETGGIYASWIP